MPLEPKRADFPRIRSALTFYRVCSIITGTFLLLLVVEVILKYTPLALEVELGGSHGFLALVPAGTVTAVNISTGLLIVHGWFYVVYLFSCFQLWSRMRWNFTRFVLLALGGIVPLLSYFLEGRIAREVLAYLAKREAALNENPTVEASH
ncbi:DUF3817 domain-containing protein [Subtercola boreus]|uniref:DUF3817 domain-containing protein n=1 Tax=Subtercola boreus TaxID=120213 RepID=A0A3E0WAZ3_9MICO|nr:DUF3817 domain-containing protein [Subtercola boreus]RFA19388.1 hypothetical protein B7R24_12150 [Subtercola boreus]RFA19649.1 hypothetical protein B7R23_12130 [Subtercola boreus]RFA26014.1 hypothetical protein B7R25_12250 [Subtercola boreus]